MTHAPFSPIEEIIEELRQGRMVVVLDDEERENEGDLVCAAELITKEHINFMATHGRGLICMPMTGDRLDELKVPMMVRDNTARRGTAFCVSIEARSDITTGISAADRARTIQVAVDPKAQPSDLASPGHVFPLRATPGGVLKRAGHTEASVDLCRMGGLLPASVICEIMNPDGTMARLDELMRFSKEHGLKMTTIAELIGYRMRTERLVRRVATREVDTSMGPCQVHTFRYQLEEQEHLAIVKGDPTAEDAVLVRVHSGRLFHDLFAPTERSQLRQAMERIAEEPAGVVLYLWQGGGLDAGGRPGADGAPVELPTRHASEDEADVRDYGIGAQILYELGIRRLRLMTNSEGKYVALDGYGLEIAERVPLPLTAVEKS